MTNDTIWAVVGTTKGKTEVYRCFEDRDEAIEYLNARVVLSSESGWDIQETKLNRKED